MVSPRIGETDRGQLGRWSLAFLIAAAGLGVVLVLQVAARVRFPWDGYVWSESPFLTNMLKLHAGRPIYGDPSDANSFVYGPGLEYLCYALLHPFGRELDVRYCRAVVVALGAGASFASGSLGGRLLAALDVPAATVRAFVAFGTIVAALILGKNYTADVCHPDNFMVLHVMVTFWLCWSAVSEGGLGRALLAVTFGSLGVLAKQTDAGMGIAALVGVMILRPEQRRAAPAAILIAATILSSGAATATLLVPGNARYWTFELISSHAFEWEKLNIYFFGMATFYHRLVLYTLAPIAACWLLLRPEPAARRFVTLWVVLGTAAAGPALLGFLKTFGAWNNLGIWDALSVLLVVPVLWSVVAATLDAVRLAGSDASNATALAAMAMGLLICLLLSAVPTRMWPSKANYAAAQELDAELLRAHRAGERVLLAHGTMALIHAGYREVPLDRANTILELVAGNAVARAGTGARIGQQLYDVLYLNVGGWYGPLVPLIEQKYEETRLIRAASARPEARGTEALSAYFGFQNTPKIMDAEVHVFRKRRATQ